MTPRILVDLQPLRLTDDTGPMMRREVRDMGVRDTPLTTALRYVEWDYGKSGWHGDETVEPALYALHYRSAKRRSIEARRLPVARASWVAGATVALQALRLVIEQWGTARFVTSDDPLWCGLAFAAEVWATSSDDPGWLDVAPSQNPCRHTARTAYGVLAEDLALVAVHHREGDDVVLTELTPEVVENLGHALVTAVSTVDYQRELDAEARRTGAPAP